MGGGAHTAKRRKAKEGSAAVQRSGAKLLGAIQKVTLAQRGAEEVGGSSGGGDLAGAEEEEVETAA